MAHEGRLLRLCHSRCYWCLAHGAVLLSVYACLVRVELVEAPPRDWHLHQPPRAGNQQRGYQSCARLVDYAFAPAGAVETAAPAEEKGRCLCHLYRLDSVSLAAFSFVTLSLLLPFIFRFPF